MLGPRALRDEDGQALLMLLGVAGMAVLATLVVGSFGQALGGRTRHARAVDLAAISAAREMRRLYPRLFEPAYLRSSVPNPRHLSRSRYIALARASAVRGGRRNGLQVRGRDVTFPASFAPTRVTVAIRRRTRVRVPGRRDLVVVSVRARATAELSPSAGAGPYAPGAYGSGGGYTGPLAYRMGKPMRPDVAEAFDRMSAAARRAGVTLSVTSGFRSDAEQARLFARNPNPKWVAPPGTSLHRYGTELDLGPPAAYPWLARNARRFGFIQRYKWESWHYGSSLAP